MHNIFALCRLFHSMTVEDYAFMIDLSVDTIRIVEKDVTQRTPYIVKKYMAFNKLGANEEAFTLLCEQNTFLQKIIFGSILGILNFIVSY